MYIAECMMPNGPMGWDPYTAYFGISKETYDRFDELGFDPFPQMKFLFCSKPEFNGTPASKAYYSKYHSGR